MSAFPALTFSRAAVDGLNFKLLPPKNLYKIGPNFFEQTGTFVLPIVPANLTKLFRPIYNFSQ
jgi:hypothetical protein